jgi:hypothetical protein
MQAVYCIPGGQQAGSKRGPALCGDTGPPKGEVAFALGATTKHTEIPKRGDSGAHKQKPRPQAEASYVIARVTKGLGKGHSIRY